MGCVLVSRFRPYNHPGNGFGAVYRAYQSAIGREVAVKVILPQYANNPDFIRRFEVEAQLIARLEHPHIVPLYDYWRDPDGAYLVMRWLKGSLRTATERGQLNQAFSTCLGAYHGRLHERKFDHCGPV